MTAAILAVTIVMTTAAANQQKMNHRGSPGFTKKRRSPSMGCAFFDLPEKIIFILYWYPDYPNTM
jgi:hypothetical protein